MVRRKYLKNMVLLNRITLATTRYLVHVSPVPTPSVFCPFYGGVAQRWPVSQRQRPPYFYSDYARRSLRPTLHGGSTGLSTDIAYSYSMPRSYRCSNAVKMRYHGFLFCCFAPVSWCPMITIRLLTPQPSLRNRKTERK